ncbi:MAG: GTP cyclohydrolase II [Actinobacteria bacterium]|nr:GTP cyclohydrolase II [Actinomycetota bacterium]|tara:strand:- start:837 stop:1478 length:642 start_codon:yes stop_codon:yes gene_type:complete
MVGFLVMGFPKIFRSLYFLRRFSSARIPTKLGEFTAHSYRNNFNKEENIALVLGDVADVDSPLVRVHSECLTGDLIGSLRCDCGSQFQTSLEMIGEEGVGIFIYLRGHEGRGIGLGKKLRAYNLQDQGLDTVDANLEQGLPVDSRDYYFAAKILQDLGVTKIRLLTNNPKKKSELEDEGIDIVLRVPLETAPTEENKRYLETKKTRLGHILND